MHSFNEPKFHRSGKRLGDSIQAAMVGKRRTANPEFNLEFTFSSLCKLIQGLERLKF